MSALVSPDPGLRIRCARLVASAMMLGGLVLAPAAHGAEVCAKSKIAETAGNAMIKAAKAGSAEDFSSALKKYANMDAIALFALGRYRKDLPSSRRAEFVSLTTSFVSRRFNDYRLKFRADSIIPVSCNGDMVRTQLNFLGGKPPQPVIWRVSGNRIADVSVQGIWLGQLLRTNFDNVLSKVPSGIEALFAHIKEQ